MGAGIALLVDTPIIGGRGEQFQGSEKVLRNWGKRYDQPQGDTRLSAMATSRVVWPLGKPGRQVFATGGAPAL